MYRPKQMIFRENPRRDYTKEVAAIDAIPKGKYDVFLGKDKIVYITSDSKIYKELKRPKHKDKLHLSALTTETNKHFVIYHNGNSLMAWNPIKNTNEMLCKIMSNSISCLIPLNGTDHIAIATANKGIQILDVTNGSQIVKLNDSNINCLYYDNDLKHLIAANAKGEMTVWNLTTNKKEQTIPGTYISYFAPDKLDLGTKGKHLVSVKNNNTIQLWEFNNMTNKWLKSKFKIRPNIIGIRSICVVDGTYVITAHEKKGIAVWHIIYKDDFLQKLTLKNQDLSIEKVISTPGFMGFYSISSGSKNKTVCGCFPSNQTMLYRSCHFWDILVKNSKNLKNPELLELKDL